MKLRILVGVAAILLVLWRSSPRFTRMCTLKTSTSVKLINSNLWGPEPYTSARRQKQLLTMMRGTWSFSRFTSPMADTKVYWKPLDADVVKTTALPGEGIETFKTAGLFKLEALGDAHHRVKYGYVLLHLKGTVKA